MNYSTFPNPNMIEGLRCYMERGVMPGGFLSAVLQNDLRAACERADIINQRLIFQTVSWLYNEAPVGSWGSHETVGEWCAARQKENG